MIAALGNENYVFLRNRVEGDPGVVRILQEALQAAPVNIDKESVTRICGWLTSIQDLSQRLTLPRRVDCATGHPIELCAARGEAIVFIEAQLRKLYEDVNVATPHLRMLGEYIERARIPQQRSVPTTNLEPNAQAPTVHREDRLVGELVEELEEVSDSEVQSDLSSKIGQFLEKSPFRLVMRLYQNMREYLGRTRAARAAARDEEKENTRPDSQNQEVRDRRFRQSPAHGIDEALDEALGTLSSRTAWRRFAQTGSDEEDVDRDALRREKINFLFDIRKIKAFLRGTPHVQGKSLDSIPFFGKEAQVLIDNEGCFERLDHYLLGLPNGKALFEIVYQRATVVSRVHQRPKSDELIITIPIVPLRTTSLPVPPHQFIHALEYLDARGKRIDQPASNELRACIGGGALVRAPSGARIVRYVVTPSPQGATLRALTGKEFQMLVTAFPAVAFDLGERNTFLYDLINQCNDPIDRLALVVNVEQQRGWVYTMDSTITDFHCAAGNTFLEAVYHTRAGICDSMSAVGAFLVGRAIGLPGIVLSGVTQEEGYFDTEIGHSVNAAILPDREKVFDFTKISARNKAVSGRAVPRSTRKTLGKAVSAEGVTRTEVAQLFDDYSYLIRGRNPDRYVPRGRLLLRLPKQRLTNEEFINNGVTQEENRKLPTLVWAANALELDAIATRCTRGQPTGELLWFVERRLDFDSIVKLKARQTETQALGITPTFERLAKRDLQDEVTTLLVRALQNHLLTRSDVERLPKAIQGWAYEYRLRIAEAQELQAIAPNAFAAITHDLLNELEEHTKSFLFEQDGAACRPVVQRVTALINRLQPTPTVKWERKVIGVRDLLVLSKRAVTHGFSPELVADVITLTRSVHATMGEQYFSTVFDSVIANAIPEYERDFDDLVKCSDVFLREAWSIDTPTGRTAFERAVAQYLIDHTDFVVAARRIFYKALEICPDLSLSDYTAQLQKPIQILVKNSLGRCRDSKKSCINWPEPKLPASSFLAEMTQGHGVDSLRFLKKLVGCGAITLVDAKALWPRTNERKLATHVVENLSLGSGWIAYSSGNSLELAKVPRILERLCGTYTDKRLSAAVKEIIAWREREGKLSVSPMQKHLLTMLDHARRIPPRLTVGDSDVTKIAIGIGQLLREALPAGGLASALHHLAPRFIPPSNPKNRAEYDLEKKDAYVNQITNLCKTLRSKVQDRDPNTLVEECRTFTRRAPKHRTLQPQEIIAACSLIEVSTLLSIDITDTRVSCLPALGLFLNTIPDDGGLPEAQIWRAHFRADRLAHRSAEEAKKNTGTEEVPKLSQFVRDITPYLRYVHALRESTRTQFKSHVMTYQLARTGRVDARRRSGIPVDHRPYTPGDSLRDIDWRRSLRTGNGSFITKVREEREERHVALVVDLELIGEECKEFSRHMLSLRYLSEERRLLPVLRSVPNLTTIVSEILMAYECHVAIDLVAVHRAHIKTWPDAGRIIFERKGGEALWAELQAMAVEATRLAREEIMLSPTILPNSPLQHGEINLRPNCAITLLLSPRAMKASLPMISLYQSKRHFVTQGISPWLRSRKG